MVLPSGLDVSVLGVDAATMVQLIATMEQPASARTTWSDRCKLKPPGQPSSSAAQTQPVAPSDASQPAKGRAKTKVAIVDGRGSTGLAVGEAPEEVRTPSFPPVTGAPDSADASRASAPPKRKRRASVCDNCFETGHTAKKCKKPPRDREKNATSMTVLPRHTQVVRQHKRRNLTGEAPMLPDARASDEPGDPEQHSESGSDCSGQVSSACESELDAANAADEEAEDVFAAGAFKGCSWERQAVKAETGVRIRGDDDMCGAPKCKNKNKSKPKKIPKSCKSAADYVSLLFNDEMFEMLVKYTNAAAAEHPRLQSARMQYWRPTTVAELKVFFGICAFLGVVRVKSRRHVWSSKTFGQRWVRDRMSKRRFDCLISAISCAAPWRLSAAELADKNAEHPFWQMRDLVQKCNENCADYWRMGRAMSIDEGCIPFKGKHRARVYNKQKPDKYHLRKYSLNCAKTGFCYCFYFYEGKGESRPRGVPATAWPVLRLLRLCPELQDRDRILALDNWFTSATAIQICSVRGVHVVGTVRQNRLSLETPKNVGGFPKEGLFKGEGQAKPFRGDMLCHKTELEIPDTISVERGKTVNAYVTCWQDSDDVTLLSTYPPYLSQCTRKVLVGKTWTAQTLPQPNVVRHYNSSMGGTDLHDMRLAFTRSTVKSRRWIVRVLNDMFSSMMMNAFLLKKLNKSVRPKVSKRYSSFDFIEEYLEEVCPVSGNAKNADGREQPAQVHPAGFTSNGQIRKFKASIWTKPAGKQWRLDGQGHYTQDANNLFTNKTDVVSATSGKVIRRELRRNCHYCNERTVYLCTKCNAPLCLGVCFETFHTKSKLMN